MKILSKLLALFFVTTAISATCHQSKIKSNFTFPKLIDSTRFIKEFTNDIEVKKYYFQLAKKGDNAIYKYNFNLSKSCIIIPGIYDRQTNITKFIKKKFNSYRWTNAFIGNKKIIGYGALEISFIPNQNKIQIEIIMGNGSSDLKKMINETVFCKSIKIEK